MKLQSDSKSTDTRIEEVQSSVSNVSKDLNLLRDGSSKLAFINHWIEQEVPITTLLVHIIDGAKQIKLDSLLVQIPTDRQLLKVEIEAIGSTKLINDYYEELVVAFKAHGFEITHFDQPRIPGGSRLVLRVRNLEGTSEQQK